MPTSIRAAVIRGINQPFVIEDLTLADPTPTQVLVKITASGVCHTDVAVQTGEFPGIEGAGAGYEQTLAPTNPPVVVGHEGAGVIEQVGSEVVGLEVGDHVALSFAACGRCLNCLSGRRSYCRLFSEMNFGGPRADGSGTMTDASGNPVLGNFFGQSSFATHSIADARNVVKLPKDVPLEISGPLGCGMQTGAGSVLNTLGVPAGASVAITGTGAVGLSAVMGAKVAGATTIIASDVVDARLELAQRLGATHTINPKTEDLAARILEITDGGGAEYAFDTTGIDAVIHALLRATAFGARLALVGVALPGAAIEQGLMFGKFLTRSIQGDAVPQNFIPQMAALHTAGRFPFDEMVTPYRFEDVNQAIADTVAGKTVKAVLVMP